MVKMQISHNAKIIGMLGINPSLVKKGHLSHTRKIRYFLSTSRL
jgi:hypothetical protein